MGLHGMDKVVATALEAVADVPDGSSLAVGGFGLSGVPNVLIGALYERGVFGLSVVSNNCGAMETGLAVLLAAGRVSPRSSPRPGWALKWPTAGCPGATTARAGSRWRRRRRRCGSSTARSM